MTIGVNQYAAYHSPEYFKDPESFIPERFLPEGQKKYESDHRDMLQPFSYGPRKWVASHFFAPI
jgi:cytochrome P450